MNSGSQFFIRHSYLELHVTYLPYFDGYRAILVGLGRCREQRVGVCVEGGCTELIAVG